MWKSWESDAQEMKCIVGELLNDQYHRIRAPGDVLPNQTEI